MKELVLASLALGIALTLCLEIGCTDTERASFGAIGSAGHITCYSADKVILDTMSTGKIQTVTNSDGWEFRDSADQKFVRVSGPCVIRN